MKNLLCMAAVTLLLSACGDGRMADTLILQGNVDVRQVSLAFEQSGRVARMDAEEGDSVKAGAVLATLDLTTLRLQAEEAGAQLEARRQELLRLRNGSRPEEIAQARARLNGAQADAARSLDDQRRLQGIATETGGKGVSAQDIDRAEKAQRSAAARVAELAEALKLAQIGARREDISGSEAQVKAAEAQLTLFKHAASQGVLRAPSDGVIRSRLLEPGDMASPQKPVFDLTLSHPKWVRIYVSETDLGRIRQGMGASVKTDSQPDQPVSGRIGYISSVAEFTPKSVETAELRTSLVYEVRVQVDDKANRLRLGQPVTVSIAVGAAR